MLDSINSWHTYGLGVRVYGLTMPDNGDKMDTLINEVNTLIDLGQNFKNSPVPISCRVGEAIVVNVPVGSLLEYEDGSNSLLKVENIHIVNPGETDAYVTGIMPTTLSAGTAGKALNIDYQGVTARIATSSINLHDTYDVCGLDTFNH